MHWLQHHWYRITPLHLILFPISLVFGVLAALRRALYRLHILPSHSLAVPVIVVGNITVGGTGKTPLTLAVAQQLIAHGWHPLIISRGYKGTSQYPQRVDPGMTALHAGDEPLLMARRKLCPVWVGTDRVATARSALQAHPQCDVVLCDDGLQHYRMRRDVEIAVIDGVRGFGNGWLLPAGPLREPASRLRTVDAVVVNVQARSPLPPSTSSGQAKPLPQRAPHLNPLPLAGRAKRGGRSQANEKGNLQSRGEGANESLCEFQFDGGTAATGQYAMRLTGAVFYSLLDPGTTATAQDFHKQGNHAVAGIGHPQRYFQHLTALGIPFTPHAFPDHHPYSATDLAFADCDAILLTEKDAVKCATFADARYWVLRVDAQIDSALTDLILRKIKSHGRQTA